MSFQNPVGKAELELGLGEHPKAGRGLRDLVVFHEPGQEFGTSSPSWSSVETRRARGQLSPP